MVEAKLKTLEEIDCWLVERVGELFGDQFRQDNNVVPRLERLEKITQKLIELISEVIKNGR